MQTIQDTIRKVIKASKLITCSDYRKALFQGSAAAIEHQNFLYSNYCKDTNFIVDIGANRGQFSLAVRHCLPNAQILAFEPLPKPAEIFLKVFDKDTNVQLINAAISHSEAKEKIHVSKTDDSSSLLPITELQNRIFPGTEASHLEYVSTTTLQSHLHKNLSAHNALMKIDVQGYELEVLKSSENVLDSFSVLYIECSFLELYKGQATAAEVINWLHARNYVLSGINSITKNKKLLTVQADLIFTKNTQSKHRT